MIGAMFASDPLSCPHHPACSGCSAIGVAYEDQLRAKMEAVRAVLDRAEVDVVRELGIRSIVAGPKIAAYRNRAKLVPAQSDEGIALGLYRAGSHEVLDIPGCPVQRDAINRVVEVIREGIVSAGVRLYDEITHDGDLRFVCVREGVATGELLVCLVTRDESFPGGAELARFIMDRDNGVVGVVQNVNPAKGNVIFGPISKTIAGRDFVTEVVCDVRIRLGATSFFQVNTAVAERAYRAILDGLAIRPGDMVADLYCGVGVIGLIAARRGARVVGIESDAGAIELARQSASANGIERADFRVGRVEDEVANLFGAASNADGPGPRTHVVVNPPRRGLDAAIVEAITDAHPARVAYLSCQPRTLVRDLDRFAKAGYRPISVELFDMFPHTDQVETLVILER